LGSKQADIDRLEALAAEPGFWEDVLAAQGTMRRISLLKEQVGKWQVIASRTEELSDLLELSVAEADESMVEDIDRETEQIDHVVGELEFQLMLGGEYDDRDGILTVHAGAGGTESQDWAQMLLRMYLRWAETRKFKSEVLSMTPGEEAGIKSATIEISALHDSRRRGRHQERHD
jgi:peptide chain release factor 2